MRVLCAALLLVFLTASADAAQPRAQVLLVGVAHLQSKRDIHNAAFVDSPLSAKRQAQIARIVGLLARFHPTKVLVEAPFGDPVYAQRYRQYLAGKFALPANEVYQFGFKLAARSGNATIYPIDTFGPDIVDQNSAARKRIDAYLMKNAANVDAPAFNAFVAKSDRIERTGTYLDVLRYINTDAAIRANASVYSVLAGMGREADNAGTVYVAQWYTRNTYIFSNILSVIHPGDRVVVLMGQGHEYLLREFIRLNPHLSYVDPLLYLK